MNGPEHYREAERLLDEMRGPNPEIGTNEDARTRTAIAQVHATLALAAATALASWHEPGEGDYGHAGCEAGGPS